MHRSRSLMKHNILEFTIIAFPLSLLLISPAAQISRVRLHCFPLQSRLFLLRRKSRLVGPVRPGLKLLNPLLPTNVSPRQTRDARSFSQMTFLRNLCIFYNSCETCLELNHLREQMIANYLSRGGAFPAVILQ